MKVELKLNPSRNADDANKRLDEAYAAAAQQYARLAGIVEAADDAKRVLNDTAHWDRLARDFKPDQILLISREYLTLHHSAYLASRNLADVHAAVTALRAAAAALHKQVYAEAKLADGPAVTEVQATDIGRYHSAMALVKVMTGDLKRVESRLEKTDEAEAAFAATCEHATSETISGWPEVFFTTPWIDVAQQHATVSEQQAKEAFLAARELVDRGDQALREVRNYRGHVLDEESYGRRLERAKNSKQRNELIAEQKARRLHLHNLFMCALQAYGQLDELCGKLVEGQKLLFAKAAQHASEFQAQRLRNNALVLISKIAEVNRTKAFILDEKYGEHGHIYAMVEAVSVEEFAAVK